MKDFNEQEHMTCPRCGFEVLYCHYNSSFPHSRVYYVFKNGEIDEATGTREKVHPNEHGKIVCNSNRCDWSN